MGHLIVAQVLTVEPCVQAGVHTLKVQICSGGVLVCGVLELGYIAAAGIFIGYIGRVSGERIADVCVVVLVITVVLPDTGNRNSIIVSGVKTQFIEQVGQIVDIGIILEFPISVEKLEAVGVFPVFYQIIPALRSRNVVGTLGHGSFVGNLKILVGCGNNHGCSPPFCWCAVQFLTLFYELFCKKGINYSVQNMD